MLSLIQPGRFLIQSGIGFTRKHATANGIP